MDPPGVESIGNTAGVPTGDGSALGEADGFVGVAPAVPPFVPFALPKGLAAKLGARVRGMALAPAAGVAPPASEGLAALNLGTLLLGVSAAAAPRLVAEAFAPEARAAAFSFACAGVTAFAGVVMLARDEGETTLPRAPPPPPLLLPPPPMLLAPLVMLPRVVMFEPICVFSCVIAIWSRSE